MQTNSFQVSLQPNLKQRYDVGTKKMSTEGSSMHLQQISKNASSVTQVTEVQNGESMATPVTVIPFGGQKLSCVAASVELKLENYGQNIEINDSNTA